jgi:hypothetical protein
MIDPERLTNKRADRERRLWNELAEFVRAHGPALFADMMDKPAAERAVADVESWLAACAAGLQPPVPIVEPGPKTIVYLTDEQIRELRGLAVRSLEHHQHMGASYRTNRERWLAGFADRGAGERWLKQMLANAGEGERFAGEEIVHYDRLLSEGFATPQD